MQDINIVDEKHTVSTVELIKIDQIVVSPKMQMRSEMNQDVIEQYAENIETILELSPIDVVAVDVDGDETWYVVDGFHRYHAAVVADLEQLKVKLMRGTYEQAVQFAMTANFKNGMRPSPEDVKRCIPLLLETAPDFKYDSAEVNRWITSFGVPASTARNHTAPLVQEIKEALDAELVRLQAEGLSQRAIAESVGCGQKTVSRRLQEIAESKSPQDKTTQEASTPIASPDDCPFDADSTDAPRFNEAKCDATPAVNPALSDTETFKTALAEREVELQVNPSLQDNSVSSSMKMTDDSNIPDPTHLIGLLNQLRAIRNSDTYQTQLTSLVENDADYIQALITTVLKFVDDLEAAQSYTPRQQSQPEFSC